MKIKKKVLVDFLTKARMEGEQMIDECILDFDKEGLKIDANSPSKQARTMSWLKTSVFKEHEAIGNVGMNDLSNAVRVLDRFGEFLNITVEGNLMTVKSEGKKVDIELVAETFLSTDSGAPKLEFDETFIIPGIKMAEIIKDVLLNKDAIITIETKEKKVLITNTGKYKFQHEIDAPTAKGGSKVKLGQPFISAVNKLDGNLEISMKSDYPIKVMEKTDDSVITLIIAPRIEDE